MITLSVEQGLRRLRNWEEVYEAPGFTQNLDPKTAQLKGIIGIYSFDSFQPCGLKDCKQPHGSGYLVVTKCGKTTNLGSICGKRNFSTNFVTLKKSFDNDLREKERRERLEALHARSSGISARLCEIRSTVSQNYRVIRCLSGESGGLPKPIVEAFRRMLRANSGEITRDRRATEDETDRAIATGLTKKGRPYVVTESLGRLAHFSAAASASELRTQIVEIDRSLTELASCEISLLSAKDARRIDAALSGVDFALERMLSTANAIERFTSHANLAQLDELLTTSFDRRKFKLYLNSLRSKSNDEEAASESAA